MNFQCSLHRMALRFPSLPDWTTRRHSRETRWTATHIPPMCCSAVLRILQPNNETFDLHIQQVNANYTNNRIKEMLNCCHSIAFRVFSSHHFMIFTFLLLRNCYSIETGSAVPFVSLLFVSSANNYVLWKWIRLFSVAVDATKTRKREWASIIYQCIAFRMADEYRFTVPPPTVSDNGTKGRTLHQ